MDNFAENYANFIIKNRWIVIILTLIAVVFLANGAQKLKFDNSYRKFFGKERS